MSDVPFTDVGVHRLGQRPAVWAQGQNFLAPGIDYVNDAVLRVSFERDQELLERGRVVVDDGGVNALCGGHEVQEVYLLLLHLEDRSIGGRAGVHQLILESLLQLAGHEADYYVHGEPGEDDDDENERPDDFDRNPAAQKTADTAPLKSLRQRCHGIRGRSR